MTDKGDVVGKVDEWASCYDLSYRGIIVPEAFGHPAKMSRGLLTRILRHAKEEGWIQSGAIVVDPFGGIGSTGILGAYEGYRLICCELEPRFVKLAKQNIALHARKLAALGLPQPVIIQGDSRRLCELLQEADLIVSSPPFYGVVATQDPNWLTPGEQEKRIPSKSNQPDYGTSPGQLGAMKPGSIDCVLSSPPFMETNTGGRQFGASQVVSQNPDRQWITKWEQGKREETRSGYGQTPGNLGNLKPGDVNLILSSPPYEKAHSPNTSESDVLNKNRKDLRKWAWNQTQQGETEGQLGNSQGPTFWEAARDIVAQCLQILRPGGVAIWVVKDFVRAKKRVDFTGDWRKLCEAVGFQTLHEHHAMLYKEDRFVAFWGEEIIDRTNRNSFFRTLTNNKAGWAAYWEIVPETERQEWLITAKEQLPPGKRQHIILGKAQELAFKDTAERIETWNEHVRIDFEVVLCMRKPE